VSSGLGAVPPESRRAFNRQRHADRLRIASPIDPIRAEQV
jgi:hypothetical protein